MNALNDSDRDAYRADLLREVLAERFPSIPWAEVHRKPMPLAYASVRSTDTTWRCAERQRELVDALDGKIGRCPSSVGRRAA
jgi:hypothetical protein